MNVKVLDTMFPSIEIHIRSDDYKFKMGENDFLFEIHETIKNPNHNLYYMTAELSGGEFPVSFYNVNQNNNRFDFSYEGTNHSCILLVGNYNMNQLLSHFSSKLTSYAFINPINISWNASNNRLTLTSAKIGGLSLKETSTCLALIGFTKKQHDADGKVEVGGGGDLLRYHFQGASVSLFIPHGQYSVDELVSVVNEGMSGRGHNLHIRLSYDIPTASFRFIHGYEINHKLSFFYAGSATMRSVFLSTGSKSRITLANELTNILGADLGVGEITVLYNTTTFKYEFTALQQFSIHSSSTVLETIGFSTADHYASIPANETFYHLVGDGVSTGMQGISPSSLPIYIGSQVEHFKILYTTNTFYLFGLTTLADHNVNYTTDFNYGLRAFAIVSNIPTAFTTGSSVLQSDSMCDIRKYSSFFLHTDLFSNGYSANTQKDNNSHNILARIPVNAGVYGTVVYKPTIPHNVPIPKSTIKVFRFSIRDFEGKIIDMNSMMWNATITIRFHKINSAARDYKSKNAFGVPYSNSSNLSALNTAHQLRSHIDSILNEYKNGNLDYSRLLVR